METKSKILNISIKNKYKNKINNNLLLNLKL